MLRMCIHRSAGVVVKAVFGNSQSVCASNTVTEKGSMTSDEEKVLRKTESGRKESKKIINYITAMVPVGSREPVECLYRAVLHTVVCETRAFHCHRCCI